MVDPDYRGNVGVLLRNHSDEAQILERGEAIAQVIMEKAAMPEVVEMKIAKDTQRGNWWVWLDYRVRPHQQVRDSLDESII